MKRSNPVTVLFTLPAVAAAVLLVPAAHAGRPSAPAEGQAKAEAKTAPPKAPPRPMAFKSPELLIAPGEQLPVELFVASPTGKRFTGMLTFAPVEGLTITPDARFDGKVPSYGVKAYPKIEAAETAEGEKLVRADLAGKATAELKVRVVRPAVELAGEQLGPGRFRLLVKVANPFPDRPFVGRFQVSNKDRFLQDITARDLRIPEGKTAEVPVPLPGAAPVEGETYDFTLKLESYAGYQEEKTYPVGFKQ